MASMSPPAEMVACSRDPHELRRQASLRGSLLLRGLIEPGDVLALRTRVLEACRDLGWLADASPPGLGVACPGKRIGAYDETWTDFQCRVVTLREFERLRRHEAILGVLEAVYGGPARWGCGDTVRVFSPSSPELTTPPHQDGYYVRGSADLWTAWIPLGDCPRELGGLAVVPGSHRDGLQPHVGEGVGRQEVATAQDMVWESTDYECGDVLLFHALAIHRALANRTTSRLRLSADFRYEPLLPPAEGGEEKRPLFSAAASPPGRSL